MARAIGPDWIAARLEGAPERLRARTLEFIGPSGDRADPASLARAARAALDRAVAGSPDRGAALDLLAADGLVTLALAAQVEVDPAGLERFARALLRGESA